MNPNLVDPTAVLEFPCEYPMRVMGINQPNFLGSVLEVVRKHAPDFDAGTLETNPSKLGNYMAIRFSIQARDRLQVDGLYGELAKLPLVKTML